MPWTQSGPLQCMHQEEQFSEDEGQEEMLLLALDLGCKWVIPRQWGQNEPLPGSRQEPPNQTQPKA